MNVSEVVADLETKSREYETAAGQCREAAGVLRRLYGLDGIGVALPAIVAPGQAIAATAPPVEAAPLALTPAFDRLQFRGKVLDTLTAHGPLKIAAIFEHGRFGSMLGGYERFQKEIRAMAEDGALTKTGERAATAYAAPAGSPAKEEL